VTLAPRIAFVGYRRYASGGTITATSEAPGYFASYLGGDALWTTVWRSALGAVSGVDIVINLGVARVVGALALVGSNLTLGATWQIWGGSDPAFVTNALAVAPVAIFNNSVPPLVDDTPPWGRHAIYLPSIPVSLQYVRIRLTDAANSAGYLRASVAVADELLQFSHHMAAQWPQSDLLQGQAGTPLVVRQASVPLNCLSRAELYQARSLARQLKGMGRLLVIPSPQSPETWQAEALWCVLSKWSEAVAIDKRGRFWKIVLEFKEVAE